MVTTFSKVMVVAGAVTLVYGAFTGQPGPVVVGVMVVAAFIWPAFLRRGR